MLERQKSLNWMYADTKWTTFVELSIYKLVDQLYESPAYHFVNEWRLVD